jgi:hypothetical protein
LGADGRPPSLPVERRLSPIFIAAKAWRSLPHLHRFPSQKIEKQPFFQSLSALSANTFREQEGSVRSRAVFETEPTEMSNA